MIKPFTPFAEAYPEAKPNTQPAPGLIVLTNPKPCHACNLLTRFEDTSKGVPVCSPWCQHELTLFEELEEELHP